MRALLFVVLIGCAAEKSAETTGSAAPRAPAPTTAAGSSDGNAPAPAPTKTGIGGIGLNQGGGGPGGAGNGEVEDPCAGGRVTDSTGGDVVGNVSSDEIHRVIKQNGKALKKCWTDSQNRDPIGGLVKVTVVFIVEANGRVSDAEATGGPQGLTDCVVAAFKTMKFDAGDGKRKLSFPLSFGSM